MFLHVLTRPDGSVLIIGPAPNAQRAGEDEVTFAARVLTRTLEANPAWAAYPVQTVTRASVAAILSNRRFRNAWTVQAGVLTYDMTKARALRMTEIRRARDARLAASDGPMLRVQEQDKAPEIAALKAYRQALRDVPQTTDLSSLTTPDALDAFEPVWPTEPAR